MAITPQPVKQVKFADPKVKGAAISWRFSHGDKGGPFSWAAVLENGDLPEVLARLAAVETLQEHQLGEDGSHSVETHKICKAAQDRLVEICHDDLDTLFSLRVSGAKRVYCIHHGNIMRVLWYDPKHEVYPSLKKHT